MKLPAIRTIQSSDRLQRTSEAGVRPRRFRPRPVLALAVLLLAVVSFVGIAWGGGGVLSVAQAQQSDGAISDLTLTSDTPGVLDVAWDAPTGDAPTDYRVNWARSDADWPSWTDESANLHPTTASQQITELVQGAEYKVRVRARYHKGTHAASPWSGPWDDATHTVAATVSVPVVVQPQQDPGAIAGLTLTSDTTGVLDVAWDAPAGDAPTDYRVNWARSDADWPSWTDESANLHPTTTSQQIAELVQGAEYKVRVRARYHKGTHAGSPWSGPWDEATQTVAAAPTVGPRTVDEPPVTLTPPVLTVIEPEEPVLTVIEPEEPVLNVFKPEEPLFSPSLLTVIKLDGPVRDAPVLTPPVLNVIKPDEPVLTPPTLTVIEPEDTDEPDEPLIALQQHSSGQPVQLGGNETQTSGGTVTVGPDGAAYRGAAVSFTPGAGAGWYELSSIKFTAGTVSPTSIHAPVRVAIHPDNGSNRPAESALYVAYALSDSGPVPAEALEARFPAHAILQPNTKYWAVFHEATGVRSFTLNSTLSNNEDSGSGFAIGDDAYTIDYLAVTSPDAWSVDSTASTIQLSFWGYAATEAVLVGAHGLRDTAADGPLLRFGNERVTKVWLNLPKSRTYTGSGNPRFVCDPSGRLDNGIDGDADDSEMSWRRCSASSSSHYDQLWAGGRSFTAGPNPYGYSITALGADIDNKVGTITPTAELYPVAAFQRASGDTTVDPKGSALASYRAASTTASPDRFARVSGPEELQVAPGSTLVAYFSNAASNIQGAQNYFEMPNAALGTDPGGESGWSLGYWPHGSRFTPPYGFAGLSLNATAGLAKRIPLNVYGWPNQPPATTHKPEQALQGNIEQLIDNLGSSTDYTIRAVDTDDLLAQAFTTGTHPAGYEVRGLQVRVESTEGFVGGAEGRHPRGRQRATGGNGAEADGLQAYPRPGVATFYSPGVALNLTADTTYWLVVGAPPSATRNRETKLGLTEDSYDECVAGDWSFAGVVHEYNGATLMYQRQGHLQMAILGLKKRANTARSFEPACDRLIPGGAAVNGRLVHTADANGFVNVGDTDWFLAQLDANVEYRFEIGTGKPYYRLSISDDQGTHLQRSEDPASGSSFAHRSGILTYTPGTTGTYYVSVSAPKGGLGTREYSLSARIIP